MPAATEMSSGRLARDRCLGCRSATVRISCGLTASTTTSASRAAAALSSVTRTAYCVSQSTRAAPACGSATTICPARQPRGEQSADEAARHVAAADECERWFIFARSLPENRRADSHPGRAGRHRRFEIARHAHRQRVERDALRSTQLPCTVRELARTTARCCLEAFARRRDAHQTAQLQARQLRARGAPAARAPSRRYAALAGLVGEPHLDTYIERRRVVRPLLAEAHGDALAIERVDPVEMLGDGARLVRLQLTDEVPGQLQVGERCELRQRFLQVVLAEIPLAAARPARGSRSAGCALLTGDEPHGIGIAAVPHCSGCDAVPCFDESVPYIAGAPRHRLDQPKSADQLTY